MNDPAAGEIAKSLRKLTCNRLELALPSYFVLLRRMLVIPIEGPKAELRNKAELFMVLERIVIFDHVRVVEATNNRDLSTDVFKGNRGLELLDGY
jgi:hypothetical protein